MNLETLLSLGYNYLQIVDDKYYVTRTEPVLRFDDGVLGEYVPELKAWKATRLVNINFPPIPKTKNAIYIPWLIELLEGVYEQHR